MGGIYIDIDEENCGMTYFFESNWSISHICLPHKRMVNIDEGGKNFPYVLVLEDCLSNLK